MNFSRQHLGRTEDGAALIEFAFVAPIFLLMLSALIEFGLISFVDGTLGTVVNNAGRLGMTGASYEDLQDPGQPPVPREEFLVDYIHTRLGPLANMGDIDIIPIPYASLSGLNAGGGTPGGYGASSEIVVYEVEFRWRILTPFMSGLIGKDGEYIIRTRTVIQNEEFS